MTPEMFNEIFEQQIEESRATLVAKSVEYSRNNDRLWNFKVAANKRNCTPEEANRGMTVKHTVSIDDMVDGLKDGKLPSYEALQEKIGDEINYLILLKAQIMERMMLAPKVTAKKSKYASDKLHHRGE